MKKSLILAAIASMSLGAIGANAAVYTISANVSNVFSSDFSTQTSQPYSPSSSVNQAPVAGGSVYEVDFYVTGTGYTSGERGFGNIVGNISSTGPVSQDSAVSGWQPYNPNVDTNGSAPAGVTSLFQTNTDAGTIGDLQNILVAIPGGITSPTTYDLRTKVGMPVAAQTFTGSGNVVNGTAWPDGKTMIGSVYFDWDGTTPASVTFAPIQASYADSTTGALIADTSAVYTNGTVNFVPAVTPEPAALSMLGLGALGLISRRRRA